MDFDANKNGSRIFFCCFFCWELENHISKIMEISGKYSTEGGKEYIMKSTKRRGDTMEKYYKQKIFEVIGNMKDVRYLRYIYMLVTTLMTED